MGLNREEDRVPGWFRRVGGDRCIAALLSFSLLFTALLSFDWGGAGLGAGLPEAAYRFLVSLGYAFACFTLLSLTRATLYVLTPAVAVISAVAAYFVKIYGIRITENTMGLLFETNLGEARGVLGADLLLWVLPALVFSALLVRRVHRASGDCRRRDRLAAALVVSALLLLGPRPAGLRGLHMSLLPASVFANANVYFREQRALTRLIETRRDLAAEARPRLEQEEGLTVVLVIGEAARSRNFHFNGYERETSPSLDALGVLPFPDVYSCETNTRYAIPCLMTRGTEADLELPYRESSLVSVFRALGFETSWLSNQGMFWSGSLVQRKFTVTATTAIASEAENVVFINRSGDVDFGGAQDEELLAPFERALAEGGPGRLLVVHLAGSHWQYDDHYPERFRRYTPTCRSHDPARCTPEELRNSYDNSLLYTDHVVGELIRRVSRQRAIVFFVSDHGEALGESGRFLHYRASADPFMRNAATFVWVSERFAAAHPDRVAALRANRFRRLSHDNVFHSVLDCAGVRADFVDREMSLCVAGTRERPPDPPPDGRTDSEDPLLWGDPLVWR